MEVPALFLRDGSAFVATPLARGPWNPAHANGSAALALAAHAVEDVPTLAPMNVARITVDLQRPLPLGVPITVTTAVTREGKKLQVVEATLSAGGAACVRATALRLREADLSGRGITTGTTDDVPTSRITPPESSINLRTLRPDPSGALLAGDILFAKRSDSKATATWIRLTTPVIEGEPIRTFSRAAYAFDFASLVGMFGDWGEVTMINPDVSAHILRPMVGEWIALVGQTRIGASHGRGMSQAEACDEQGVFAVVSTSQLVDLRG